MPITDLTGTKWKFNDGFGYAGVPTSSLYAAFEVWAKATFGDIIVDVPQYGHDWYEHDVIVLNATNAGGSPIQFPVYGSGSTRYLRAHASYISPSASENGGKWIITQYTSTSSSSKTETIYDGDAYITFTGGRDVKNSTLISYMEKIATFVENVEIEETADATSVVVTYDGKALEVEQGKTVVFDCEDKKMKTDIAIGSGSSAEVVYGDIVCKVPAGQTVLLECAGKKMKHPVVARVREPAYIVSDRWLLNDTIDFSTFKSELVQAVTGKVNGSFSYLFSLIKITPSSRYIQGYIPDSSYRKYMYFYSGDSWTYGATVIDFKAHQEVSYAFYTWLKANAIKVNAPSKGRMLYNGVRLPSIPDGLSERYPYAWIRRNESTGCYDLIMSDTPYYFNEEFVYEGNGKTHRPWYRIGISAAETATSWSYYDATTKSWGIDTAQTVLWSNHDIPNGSAEATDIYFVGTEAIPTAEV